MKTIGKLLQESRQEKKLTLSQVEQTTKIRRDFIVSIEKHNWSRLPEFPVVLGFVKNLAQTYGINRDKAVALLRRDYPPKKLPINPKPDLKKEFSWSPRLTFLAGVLGVIALVVGYLVFQYIRFTSPPLLEVFTPQEGQVIVEDTLLVTGKTDNEATVSVNNQPAYIDEDGNFSTEIELSETTVDLVFKAVSRSGKESTIVRHIQLE